MRSLVAFFVLIGCGPSAAPVAPPPSPAASPSANVAVSDAELPLHFRGTWRDPAEQIVFSFDLRLERSGTTLTGRILWTLVATPPEHPLADRVNEVGTETVVGEWDESARLITLRGTQVDSTLLATDQYKLTITPDGSGFTGKTRGHAGTWKNDITGERVKP